METESFFSSASESFQLGCEIHLNHCRDAIAKVQVMTMVRPRLDTNVA
jgi:hypothetical protein